MVGARRQRGEGQLSHDLTTKPVIFFCHHVSIGCASLLPWRWLGEAGGLRPEGLGEGLSLRGTGGLSKNVRISFELFYHSHNNSRLIITSSGIFLSSTWILSIISYGFFADPDRNSVSTVLPFVTKLCK